MPCLVEISPAVRDIEPNKPYLSCRNVLLQNKFVYNTIQENIWLTTEHICIFCELKCSILSKCKIISNSNLIEILNIKIPYFFNPCWKWHNVILHIKGEILALKEVILTKRTVFEQ